MIRHPGVAGRRFYALFYQWCLLTNGDAPKYCGFHSSSLRRQEQVEEQSRFAPRHIKPYGNLEQNYLNSKAVEEERREGDRAPTGQKNVDVQGLRWEHDRWNQEKETIPSRRLRNANTRRHVQRAMSGDNCEEPSGFQVLVLQTPSDVEEGARQEFYSRFADEAPFIARMKKMFQCSISIFRPEAPGSHRIKVVGPAEVVEQAEAELQGWLEEACKKVESPVRSLQEYSRKSRDDYSQIPQSAARDDEQQAGPSPRTSVTSCDQVLLLRLPDAFSKEAGREFAYWYYNHHHKRQVRIGRESGAYVEFSYQPREESDGPELRHIKLFGSPEAIEKARDLLQLQLAKTCKAFDIPITSFFDCGPESINHRDTRLRARESAIHAGQKHLDMKVLRREEDEEAHHGSRRFQMACALRKREEVTQELDAVIPQDSDLARSYSEFAKGADQLEDFFDLVSEEAVRGGAVRGDAGQGMQEDKAQRDATQGNFIQEDAVREDTEREDTRLADTGLEEGVQENAGQYDGTPSKTAKHLPGDLVVILKPPSKIEVSEAFASWCWKNKCLIVKMREELGCGIFCDWSDRTQIGRFKLTGQPEAIGKVKIELQRGLEEACREVNSRLMTFKEIVRGETHDARYHGERRRAHELHWRSSLFPSSRGRSSVIFRPTIQSMSMSTRHSPTLPNDAPALDETEWVQLQTEDATESKVNQNAPRQTAIDKGAGEEEENASETEKQFRREGAVFVILVPPAHAPKKVLAKFGSFYFEPVTRLQRLRKEKSCRIDFNFRKGHEKDRVVNTVKITGQLDAVEKVKNELQHQLANMCRTLDIPKLVLVEHVRTTYEQHLQDVRKQEAQKGGGDGQEETRRTSQKPVPGFFVAHLEMPVTLHMSPHHEFAMWYFHNSQNVRRIIKEAGCNVRIMFRKGTWLTIRRIRLLGSAKPIERAKSMLQQRLKEACEATRYPIQQLIEVDRKPYEDHVAELAAHDRAESFDQVTKPQPPEGHRPAYEDEIKPSAEEQRGGSGEGILHFKLIGPREAKEAIEKELDESELEWVRSKSLCRFLDRHVSTGLWRFKGHYHAVQDAKALLERRFKAICNRLGMQDVPEICGLDSREHMTAISAMPQDGDADAHVRPQPGHADSATSEVYVKFGGGEKGRVVMEAMFRLPNLFAQLCILSDCQEIEQLRDRNERPAGFIIRGAPVTLEDTKLLLRSRAEEICRVSGINPTPPLETLSMETAATSENRVVEVARSMVQHQARETGRDSEVAYSPTGQRTPDKTSTTSTTTADDHGLFSQELIASRNASPEEPRSLTATEEEVCADVRNVLRTLVQPVVLITTATKSRDGRLRENGRGLTVSSFSTVTMKPLPIISFNVKLPSRTWDAMMDSKHVRIHLLAASPHGAAVADAFTKPREHPHQAFEALEELDMRVDYFTNGSDNPAPAVMRAGAVVADMGARVMPQHCMLVGDHVIVVAKVLECHIPQYGGYSKEILLEKLRSFEGLSYMQQGYRAQGQPITPFHPSKPNADRRSPAQERGRPESPSLRMKRHLSGYTSDARGFKRDRKPNFANGPYDSGSDPLGLREQLDQPRAFRSEQSAIDNAMDPASKPSPPEPLELLELSKSSGQAPTGEEATSSPHQNADEDNLPPGDDFLYDSLRAVRDHGRSETVLGNVHDAEKKLASEQEGSADFGFEGSREERRSSRLIGDAGDFVASHKDSASFPSRKKSSRRSSSEDSSAELDLPPPVKHARVDANQGTVPSHPKPAEDVSSSTDQRPRTSQSTENGLNVARAFSTCSRPSMRRILSARQFSSTALLRNRDNSRNGDDDSISKAIAPSARGMTAADFFGLQDDGWAPVFRIRSLVRKGRETYNAKRRLESEGELLSDEERQTLERKIFINERITTKKLGWNAAAHLRIMLDKGRVDFKRARFLENAIEKGQAVLLEEARQVRKSFDEGKMHPPKFVEIKEKLERDYQTLETEVLRLRAMVDEDTDESGRVDEDDD